MKQATKVVLAVELYENGIPKMDIARRIGVHRETVGIWLSKVELLGLEGFREQLSNAKKALENVGKLLRMSRTRYSRFALGKWTVAGKRLSTS